MIRIYNSKRLRSRPGKRLITQMQTVRADLKPVSTLKLKPDSTATVVHWFLDKYVTPSRHYSPFRSPSIT